MPKVCIVTGASRGMGRGISKVLAQEEGATVYATARSEDALKELAASVDGATFWQALLGETHLSLRCLAEHRSS